MSFSYISEIKQLLQEARQKAYTAVNTAMVEAYWNIGKRIIIEEQKGEKRAAYGEGLLQELSKELTVEFGKGFSARNIRNFRQFYVTFPDLEKWQTLSAKLSWSHFQAVLRVTDEKARLYYLTEASINNWSIRKLDRNISTLYYQRLLSSQLKNDVIDEMEEHTENASSNLEFIKNPYVLEFLNLPNNLSYKEKDVENAIIAQLQNFLLELGKGFAFVAQQKLIRTDGNDFYIDLVFYNYLLKCFVIIDIKNDRMNHQDVGQLDMYVRMYNEKEKQPGDNPTIGILLCSETDQVVAKYSVLSENKQLFATKYMPFLPTEAELIAEIEREKRIILEKTIKNKDDV